MENETELQRLRREEKNLLRETEGGAAAIDKLSREISSLCAGREELCQVHAQKIISLNNTRREIAAARDRLAAGPTGPVNPLLLTMIFQLRNILSDCVDKSNKIADDFVELDEIGTPMSGEDARIFGELKADLCDWEKLLTEYERR